jgi:hypothetical protein
MKQFDTEETCLIHSGDKLNYTWRTHKKAQLVQLFVKEYRIISKPFQMNKNGVQEIEFMLLQNSTNENCYLTCIVNIETKYQAEKSSFYEKNLGNSFKKYVLIQSKFLVCNYMNMPIDSFSLSYSFLNKNYEIKSQRRIESFSRSNVSFEIFNNQNSVIDINLLRINESNVIEKSSLIKASKIVSSSTIYSLLKNGLICMDQRTKLKYWLNLYEQYFVSKNQKSHIIQFNLILSPVFVFCSYLPHDLGVEFDTNNDKHKTKYTIKSNSVSYNSEFNFSNELAVKFDLFLGSEKNKYLEFNENKNLWFEQINHFLEVTSINVSTCEKSENKRLLYASRLFEHINRSDSFDPTETFSQDFSEEFKLEILVNNDSRKENEQMIEPSHGINDTINFEKELTSEKGIFFNSCSNVKSEYKHYLFKIFKFFV